MKNQELVTIYQSTTFGIAKFEGVLVKAKFIKYAQYDKALAVHFIPKGKRKCSGFVATFQPYVVVLAGINHPSPDDAYCKPERIDENTVIKVSKFFCFDPRYKTEFDAKISEYLKDQKVIVDVRHTVNTNSINN